MITGTVLEDLMKKNCPIKKCFYSSVNDGATSDNGEKLNGQINDEKCLMCYKIWKKFNMKNMGDYHDH